MDDKPGTSQSRLVSRNTRGVRCNMKKNPKKLQPKILGEAGLIFYKRVYILARIWKGIRRGREKIQNEVIEDDDPYFPRVRVIRKKSGESRLDFTDPAVIGWMRCVLGNYPELYHAYEVHKKILGLIKLDSGKTLLEYDESIAGKVWETGSAELEANAEYLDLLLHLKIGIDQPKIDRYKDLLTKEEWDAWCLYYSLLQFFRHYVTPSYISDASGQSILDVNSAFRAVKRRIESNRGAYELIFHQDQKFLNSKPQIK
jgi:hypothetical protein